MSPGGWIIGAGGVSSGPPPAINRAGGGAQMNAIRGCDNLRTIVRLKSSVSRDGKNGNPLELLVYASRRAASPSTKAGKIDTSVEEFFAISIGRRTSHQKIASIMRTARNGLFNV